MVIDLSYSILLMVIPSFTFFIILPLTLKFNNSFTTSMILATIFQQFLLIGFLL